MLDPQKRVNRIWQRYARTRSLCLRNELILHYTPLVRSHAAKLHVRFPSCVECDDLVSLGILGLVQAIETFDVQRGTPFQNYIARRIPGAIVDGMRELDWVPRSVRNITKILAEITEKKRAETGRTPTDQEIASQLPVTPAQQHAVLRNARPPILVSLSTSTSLPHDEPLTPQYQDPRSPDPKRIAARNILKHTILKGLSRCERLIILLYYYEQMSMKEIGRVLDLSESRVSQLHKLLLNRLRSSLQPETLLIESP